jgi:hypothetical protein
MVAANEGSSLRLQPERVTMNSGIVALAVLIALAPLSASSAEPALVDSPKTTTCVATGSVDHTHVIDDDNILYVMSNGKVWRNHLEATCTSLDINQGFSIDVWGGTVCKHQAIHVLHTHNLCFLGDFIAQEPDKGANP